MADEISLLDQLEEVQPDFQVSLVVLMIFFFTDNNSLSILILLSSFCQDGCVGSEEAMSKSTCIEWKPESN